MKRYLLNPDSPDRFYYYRLALYLCGFAAAGVGIVLLEM